MIRSNRGSTCLKQSLRGAMMREVQSDFHPWGYPDYPTRGEPRRSTTASGSSLGSRSIVVASEGLIIISQRTKLLVLCLELVDSRR